MAEYEKRTIGGSTYTVPKGLRSDWKPGQAYNISSPSSGSSSSKTSDSSSGSTSSARVNAIQNRLSGSASSSNDYSTWAKSKGYTDTRGPGDLPREEVNRMFGVTSPTVTEGIYKSPSGGIWKGTTTSDAYGSSSAFTPLSTEELNRMLGVPQQPSYQTWTPPQLSQPQTPVVQPPPKIEESPTLEIPKTEETPQAAEQVQEDLPKGPGGFERAGAAVPYLPSVEKLYEQYKQVAGGEDEGMRQYLASPQFQGMLQSGRVPMYMATDPIMRLYLMRIGVLNPTVDTARQEALRRAAAQ